MSSKIISTHTLTWSVTYSGFATGTNYQDFNSHAHVERDLRSSVPLMKLRNFNSHAHVERDGGVFV